MRLSAPYDARAVANFVLELAESFGEPLTQLSLLKIVYFAHGWYLVKTGVPLVAQPVECWKYGPVIKVIRDAFKEYGSEPIRSKATKLDIRTGEVISVAPDINEEDGKFVSDIFRTYRVYGAWRLSDMTHDKGSPWDNVWNASSAVGSLGLRIKNEDIRAYFSRMTLPEVLH